MIPDRELYLWGSLCLLICCKLLANVKPGSGEFSRDLRIFRGLGINKSWFYDIEALANVTNF